MTPNRTRHAIALGRLGAPVTLRLPNGKIITGIVEDRKNGVIAIRTDNGTFVGKAAKLGIPEGKKNKTGFRKAFRSIRRASRRKAAPG